MPGPAVSLTNAFATTPYVIADQPISRFKFYKDQSVQDGMTHGNELYRFAEQFDPGNRLEAYRFGCELIGQGVSTVISVSKQCYIVWISLRNPLAATLIAS